MNIKQNIVSSLSKEAQRIFKDMDVLIWHYDFKKQRPTIIYIYSDKFNKINAELKKKTQFDLERDTYGEFKIKKT